MGSKHPNRWAGEQKLPCFEQLMSSRGDWTPIELFLGGVAEFDSTIVRLLMAA